MRTIIPFLALVAGCWQTELTELMVDAVAFEPMAGAPAGWVVQGFDLELECPTGQLSVLYAVYPQAPTTEPMPVTVLLHSGSFDYVRQPSAEDPLAGLHFQPESRLSREWAQRRAFTTLGMYDDADRFEDHTGAVATALVEQGQVVLVPTNCWGDTWHNAPVIAENDVSTEAFTRQGRTAAEWAWRVATEEGFGATVGVDLPVTLDRDQAHAVGLGEGGRAVGELLEAGYAIDSIVVDSVVDDLRIYYSDQALYGEVITGLDRIFPDGDPRSGALGWAPLPDRLVYLYSSQDAQIPAAAHNRILGLLAEMPDAWVNDAGGVAHVVLADDLELSRQAVEYMLAE